METNLFFSSFFYFKRNVAVAGAAGSKMERPGAGAAKMGGGSATLIEMGQSFLLTNLASLGIGGEQVDHLDASHQDLLLHAHLAELGRLRVDRLIVTKKN